MKFKVTAGAARELWEQHSTEEGRAKRLAFARMVVHTNGPEFATLVHERVLVPHLRIPPEEDDKSFGAAEAFFQQTDIAVARTLGQYCFHVGISGVSVNK